ncbi:hypothetical protein MIT9_P1273 [Methylomarinovum caldicuralii]|uniref:DUF2782 domain-containing protein n=1 Tax=Methylomarinovum caldicuralii TaxID=438856 RepID=A0AAU9CFD5_9GAMM|nr:DUF2782 domain-containing protein [Methylomarinovum caldicuralii]BCX81695.1 hypothetical protein MIT9_P1273 [Methylomarinovum caldicuralii]
MRRLLPVLLPLLIGGAARGADDDAPPPLEPLPEVEEDQELQPEVTIRRRGKSVIEEYRIGGQLYMIKVIPPIGPPYYLVDTDADGTLDTRRSDLEEGARVHQWRILEW